MEEMKAMKPTINIGMSLLESIVKDLKKLVGGKLRNKNQCMHLVSKVDECIQKVKILVGGCARMKMDVVLTEVLHVVMKVQALIEDCAQEDGWSEVAMTLIGNMESYRELLVDLECVFHVACSIFYKCHPHENVDGWMGSMDFYPLVGFKLEEDKDSLLKWLKNVSKSPTLTKDATLFVHYLCKWIECLRKVEGGDLDCMVYPDLPWSHCCLMSLSKDKKFCKDHMEVPFERIGGDESGGVLKTKCLGMDCAVKIIKGSEEQVSVEVGVLGGLNHPNITKLIGYGRLDDPNKIGCGEVEGDENVEKHFLVMEVLEGSLSKLLRTLENKVSFLVAVDMMLQIARGLCYLHDMKIAHCDLKPENVLVHKLKHPCLGEELVVLKLVDFGLSKINAPRSRPSQFYGPIGTTRYMAPESIACERGEVREMNSYSLDVFAFGMMCFEILSKEKPYEKEGLKKMRELKEAIVEGCRPKLPSDCPSDLQSLIEECWSREPMMRPTSSAICNRLMRLKKELMEGEAFEVECSNKSRVELLRDWLCQRLKMVGFTLKSQVMATCEKIILMKSMFGAMEESNGVKGEESCGLQSANVEIVGIDDVIAKGQEELQACKVLGLVGMGGVGKTTLARAILKSMQEEFDGHCFLENMKAQTNNLDVVKNVLRDLGKDHENVRDIQEGIECLVLAFIGKKVLIVLDDISNEQVVALSDLQRLDYGKGSKLIITTRDEGILVGFEMHVHCMDVSGLGEGGAREVFAKYAYNGGRRHLPYIIDMERKIIEACKGLPLSLEVMGAYLGREERLRVWERALSRLLRGRTLDAGDKKLWMSLRVSFDNLGDYEKKAFLDISRFFVKGVCPGKMRRFMAMELWSFGEGSPNQSHAIDVLVKRSLLKVDEEGCLTMHDQLRDMGCNIVEEDVVHMNTRWEGLTTVTFDAYSKRGVGNLEGLSFKTCEQYVEGLEKIGNMPSLRILEIKQCKDLRMVAWILKHSKCIEYFGLKTDDTTVPWMHEIFESLASCKRLCVLKLSCRLTEELLEVYGKANCFTTLKILSMHFGFGLAVLPKAFGNLVALKFLDMWYCSSLAVLPEAFGNLVALKTLDMSFCSSLAVLPEAFGNLVALKTLDIRSCKSLVGLPEAFGSLVALESLDMSSCSSLATLPEAFGNLVALKTLILSKSSSLLGLPEAFGNLVALETLNMSFCERLRMLPEAFCNLVALKTLNIRSCKSLVGLPEAFGSLVALESLDMSSCLSLASLPEAFGNLVALESLDMSSCSSLASLPEAFGNLVALEFLNLNSCSSLAMLPEAFCNLVALKTLNMSSCKSFVVLPKAFGNLVALKSLDMGYCSSLVVLPETFGNLVALKSLDMSYCSSLAVLSEAFGNLVALGFLNLECCSSLALLPEAFGNLVALESLNLFFCSSLTVLPEAFCNLVALKTLNMSFYKSLAVLPEAFGNLVALKSLEMGVCSSLVVLPETFGNLVALESLNMRYCSSLAVLPEAFGNLLALKTLNMSNCSSWVVLPEAFGNLVSLKTLDMSSCSSLAMLPEAFCSLVALKTLDMSFCKSLAVLPEAFGNLVALKSLEMGVCSSLVVLPETFGNLVALESLNMRYCSSLAMLPEAFGNLVALESLNLECCSSLALLPEAFGNLVALESLNLFFCSSLAVLPEAFGNLVALESLSVKYCSSLAVLPEAFGNLVALKTLNMSNCSSLVVLPEAFGNLVSLRTLDMSSCKSLAVLPETFGNLVALESLNMRYCSSLAMLPEALGNLVALESLNLECCSSLVVLPEAFGNLVSLRILDMSSCKSLAILPKSFGNLVLGSLNLDSCSSLAVPGAFRNLGAPTISHINLTCPNPATT